MTTNRRQVVTWALALAVAGGARLQAQTGTHGMYGLIGKFTAADGQREALIEILLDGMADMPGCYSYVVARDPADETTIWITEVWDSADSHRASLDLPSVQAAIARGRPLIAGMDRVAETAPVGGHGLAAEPL